MFWFEDEAGDITSHRSPLSSPVLWIPNHHANNRSIGSQAETNPVNGSCSRVMRAIYLFFGCAWIWGVCLPASLTACWRAGVSPGTQDPTHHRPAGMESPTVVARIHTEGGEKRKECKRRQSGRDNGGLGIDLDMGSGEDSVTPLGCRDTEQCLVGRLGGDARRGRAFTFHEITVGALQALWLAGCRDTLERGSLDGAASEAWEE
jgi:hypothetical protein